MSYRRLAAYLVALALAGCGSATDELTFKVPAGYVSSLSVGPFVQIWKGPRPHTALMLMALPTKASLRDIQSNADVKDAQIVSQSNIRICGDQPARYVSLVGEHTGVDTGSSDRVKEQVDMVATYVNSKTYMGIYARPVGSPVDAAAESAIHDLCPKT